MPARVQTCNTRVPLQALSASAENGIRKKRGTKPKTLSEQVRKCEPPAQRIEWSYSRDKKLRVLGY